MREGLNSYLTKAFGGTFIVYSTGVALAFLAQLVLTRLLGAASYGEYYFVLAWVMVLLVFAKSGADNALLRFVPAYIARKEWGLARGFVHWSLKRILATSAVAIAVLVTFVNVLNEPLGADVDTFYVGAAIVPVLAYVYIRAALLKSLKHVVLALLPETVLAPTVLILVMAVLSTGAGGQLTATDAMLATFAGFLCSAVVGFVLLKRRLPVEMKRPERHIKAAEWSKSSRSMLLITGAHMLLSNTDAIMLGFLSDSVAVGVYAVAAKCSVLVFFPLIIANVTIGPMIPHFHATSDHAQLQKALDQSMKLVSYLSLAAFVALVLVGQQLLVLFGEEFSAGYVALLVLGVGGLTNALSGPVANLLSLTGSERLVSRILVMALALNLILNLLLIPLLDILGAAIATAASMAAWNLVMYAKTHSILGLEANSLLGRTLRRVL